MVGHLYERLGGGNLREETIHDFFERWLERKAGEVTAGTLRKYRETVNHLLAYVGAGGRKRDLASLSARDLVAFRDDLAKRLSVGTVNCAVKIIRAGLRDALRARLVSVNEAAGVRALAVSKARVTRRAFTVPELRRLLAVADPEWRVLILAGYHSAGQRLGDVARWTWGDVDFAQDEIRFRTRKTGLDQVIPIGAELRAALLALPRSDDARAPVFAAAFAVLGRGKIERVGSLSNQFHKLMVAAGLAESRGHSATGQGRSTRRRASELGFHSLRHTATSIMKTAGIGGAIVQDLVGHDSAAISQHYTHIDAAAKRVALGVLPALDPPLAAVA